MRALENSDPSVRVRAAMAIGTNPDPDLVDRLVERCAVEPDFFVREALTWALTRHPAAVTVPKLVDQLRSESAQARSQALHTLSKIGDPRAWPAITRDLLTDPDDEVARAAWRTAAALAPEDRRPELAAVLVTQFGRGDRETRLSLSRALVALGDEVVLPILEHAVATERLLRDPDAAFELSVREARKVSVMGDAGADR